MAEFNTKLH